MSTTHPSDEAVLESFGYKQVFAELASQFPIAGGIYQWSRRLAGPTYAWFAGWIVLVSRPQDRVAGAASTGDLTETREVVA